MEKKVKIGNKEFGEGTLITTSIKTIVWFLSGVAGVILFLTTYFYISLKNQLEENADKDIERSKNIKQEVLFEVKAVSEDTEKIEEDVWEIKGDIKLLLDRTNGGLNQGEIRSTTSSPPPLDSLGTSN
jgi:hypothetical protein